MFKIFSLNQGHGPLAILESGYYTAVCCVSFHDVAGIHGISSVRNFNVMFHIEGGDVVESFLPHELLHLTNVLATQLQENIEALVRVVGIRDSGLRDSGLDWKIKGLSIIRLHGRAGSTLEFPPLHWTDTQQP
jgi:hypothetical protein